MRALLVPLAAVAVAVVLAGPAVAGGVGTVPAAPPPRPGEDPARWTTPPPARRWAPGDPATTPARPDPATLPVPASVAVAPAPVGFGPLARAPEAPRCDVGPDAPCGFPTVAAWGGAWFPTISGTQRITRGGRPGSGSEIDVDDVQGLDDGFAWHLGVGWAPWPRHRFAVEYEHAAFDAETVLPETVVYRDGGFFAGERVASDLELSFLKAAWSYRLLDAGTTSVDAGVGAWWWRYDGSFTSRTTGVSHSRSFSHVLPVAHVAAATALGVLRLSARAAAGTAGADRFVVDLEGAVGVRLGGRFLLDAGWRWMRLAFDETTNEADLVLHGPFLRLGVEL